MRSLKWLLCMLLVIQGTPVYIPLALAADAGETDGDDDSGGGSQGDSDKGERDEKAESDKEKAEKAEAAVDKLEAMTSEDMTAAISGTPPDADFVQTLADAGYAVENGQIVVDRATGAFSYNLGIADPASAFGGAAAYADFSQRLQGVQKDMAEASAMAVANGMVQANIDKAIDAVNAGQSTYSVQQNALAPETYANVVDSVNNINRLTSDNFAETATAEVMQDVKESMNDVNWGALGAAPAQEVSFKSDERVEAVVDAINSYQPDNTKTSGIAESLGIVDTPNVASALGDKSADKYASALKDTAKENAAMSQLAASNSSNKNTSKAPTASNAVTNVATTVANAVTTAAVAQPQTVLGSIVSGIANAVTSVVSGVVDVVSSVVTGVVDFVSDIFTGESNKSGTSSATTSVSNAAIPPQKVGELPSAYIARVEKATGKYATFSFNGLGEVTNIKLHDSKPTGGTLIGTVESVNKDLKQNQSKAAEIDEKIADIDKQIESLQKEGSQ
jgi:hypothetical protein